ncbi:hypothetical protein E8P82_05595 [Arthrobacter echini]|uniref:VOC domain-containing protein n=1 Tax=Arthrobacter echini TaxID=1529066 RepID=A0A4S5E5Y9_9MICC|nr:VOC family protein [Arthrobacter echini]THJ66937.1 hypothetical protein E8P82_05595 [Arthrobacter echini]
MTDQQGVGLGSVGNVFLFVRQFDDAVDWYERFVGRPPEQREKQLAVWQLDGVRLTVHSEDEYNVQAADTAGTVAYFGIDDVDAALAYCEKLGATAHRGPKTIFSGERLLQVRDPFGNLFGLVTPPQD